MIAGCDARNRKCHNSEVAQFSECTAKWQHLALACAMIMHAFDKNNFNCLNSHRPRAHVQPHALHECDKFHPNMIDFPMSKWRTRNHFEDSLRFKNHLKHFRFSEFILEFCLQPSSFFSYEKLISAEPNFTDTISRVTQRCNSVMMSIFPWKNQYIPFPQEYFSTSIAYGLQSLVTPRPIAHCLLCLCDTEKFRASKIPTQTVRRHFSTREHGEKNERKMVEKSIGLRRICESIWL